MITKTGEVKGLDFGLAKETAAEPVATARVPIRIRNRQEARRPR